MKVLATILLLACTAILGAGCRDQPDKAGKVQDTTDPVRTAIAKQYAQQARAYYEDDPMLIRAVRAPEFSAQPPNGPRSTPEEVDFSPTASPQTTSTL